MNIKEIKSQFEKEYPSPAKSLEKALGKEWHIEWNDPYSAGDEYLSYSIGLWQGFLAGYVRAEKNMKVQNNVELTGRAKPPETNN